MSSQPRTGAVVLAYTAWLGLAILAGVVALQLNILILFMATLVIENPALRPVGWNSSTLVNIQRLSGLVLGSIWLMYILWMEHGLRSAARDGKLPGHIARLTAGMVAILALVYAILWLAGRV